MIIPSCEVQSSTERSVSTYAALAAGVVGFSSSSESLSDLAPPRLPLPPPPRDEEEEEFPNDFLLFTPAFTRRGRDRAAEVAAAAAASPVASLVGALTPFTVYNCEIVIVGRCQRDSSTKEKMEKMNKKGGK